eukprot:2206957-Amphidinium_carterae.1
MVHQLLLCRAHENGVPEAQQPQLLRIAPHEDQQHGVIVHGYTGTPAFSMDEPIAANIHSMYRDPRRACMDNDDHAGR